MPLRTAQNFSAPHTMFLVIFGAQSAGAIVSTLAQHFPNRQSWLYYRQKIMLSIVALHQLPQP